MESSFAQQEFEEIRRYLRRSLSNMHACVNKVRSVFPVPVRQERCSCSVDMGLAMASTW